MRRRRTGPAAACALALCVIGLAGCGASSSRRPRAAKTAAATKPTRTVTNARATAAGTAQEVALTGTSTGQATVTGGSATVTGATATVTGATTTGTGTSSSTSTVGTISDPTGIGVTSGGILSLGRPFAADSPWNTPVTNAAIASNSARLIELSKERLAVTKGASLESLSTGLVAGSSDTGTTGDQTRSIDRSLFINTTVWTDPIVLANGGNQVQLVCRQVNLPPPNNDCGDGWQVATLSIPSTGFPKPSYDGWLTVIDENAGYAYDFWRARLRGSVMTYQFLRRWTLDGPGFLGPNYPSARGSGLPLFAGEILPKELLAGHIDHALAISIPGPASRFYVQPASATDGNGAFGSLPEGARLRLKASFDIARQLAHLPGGVSVASARTILTALRTYGAFVVDRGAVPTLYAVPNYDWSAPLRTTSGRLLSPDGKTPLPPAYQDAKKYGTPILSGSAVSFLKLDDFEVVKLPPVLEFPPVSGTNTSSGVNGVQPQSVLGAAATGASLSTTGGSASAGSTGVGSATP